MTKINEMELESKIEQFEMFQRQHIGPHILLAARKVKQFAINHLSRFNIGFEQIGILHILSLTQKLNINQIAQIMDKDRGTISRCVESLCTKQYVTKTKKVSDKRVHIVKITKKGQEFLDSVADSFREITYLPEHIMTNDELELSHKILDKLIEYYKEAQKKVIADKIKSK